MSEIEVIHTTLDKIDLPKIVYKYRNWSDNFNKRFITEREVFMASPGSFEDKLDCNNPTRFDLLTKNEIYQYFIWSSKEMNPNFTRQRHRNFAREWSKQSLVNNPKYVKEFMDRSIIDYYEHDGILSLTENWNNDDMWIKYADNHKGFCIGYNTRTLFKFLGGGGPVDYVDELPMIKPEPIMQAEEAMRNRVYYKTKNWSFEEEYRTKKFWPHPASIEERQIKLPIEAYNCIIFGKNISGEHENEIIEATNNAIGNVRIVKRKDYK